jgi:hypothetical protein
MVFELLVGMTDGGVPEHSTRMLLGVVTGSAHVPVLTGPPVCVQSMADCRHMNIEDGSHAIALLYARLTAAVSLCSSNSSC